MECSLRHGDGMASADRFLDDYRATFGDAEAELDWTVYHVQPRQGFSDHHSLYLASDHNMGLIIEPNKRCDRAGKDAATVAVRPLHFDPNRHGNLTKTRLGCTRMSGSSIFRIALDIVKQMGNDCIEMDYCSKVSTELGCSELCPVTRSGVASAVSSAAFGMYQMFSRSRPLVAKDKKKL